MAIVMKYHLLMSNLVYIAEVRPKFSALHFCYFLQRSLVQAVYLRIDTIEQVLKRAIKHSNGVVGPEGYMVCNAVALDNLRLGLTLRDRHLFLSLTKIREIFYNRLYTNVFNFILCSNYNSAAQIK